VVIYSSNPFEVYDGKQRGIFLSSEIKFTATILEGGVPKRAHFLLSPTHKWFLK